MRSFISWLNESVETKQLKHLQHAEDLPTVAGQSGARHAITTLHQVHKQLTGKHAPVSVSTKHDGSPSVVFGHHPQSGHFFVATKSAFNKNPKINHTEADIEKNHGHAPGLVSKLKDSLHHLPKVVPGKGVYQGDLMYSKHDVHTNEVGNHSFTPNTLTYHTHKNSHEGKKVSAAKLGVVIHTKYHGNSIEGMHAQGGPFFIIVSPISYLESTECAEQRILA